LADFDLSAVVKLDASGVEAGAEDIASGISAIDKAQKATTDSSADLGKTTAATGAALDSTSKSATQLAVAEAKVAVAASNLATAQQKVADAATGSSSAQVAAAGALARAQLGVAQASASLQNAQARIDASNDSNVASSGRASQANIILQSAIRKTTNQFAAGAPASTIFAEHIETLVEVLELYASSRAAKATAATAALGEGAVEAGAKAGLFTGFLTGAAEFLSGPWGIALTVGAAALGPLVTHLLDGKPAADDFKKALEGIADEQKALGAAVDQTTGKINAQNAALGKAASLAAPTSIRSGIRSIGQNSIDAFKAVTDASSVQTSRAGPTGEVLELRRALLDANGDFVKLQANIAALPAGSDGLENLKAKVAGLGVSAATTNKGIHDLAGAQRDANTVLNGGTVLTKEGVEAQIALATANDAGSKANARLAASQAKLNDLFSKPSSAARDAAIQSAKADVIAAQKAVDVIQSATKTRTKKTPQDTLTPRVTEDIRSITEQFSDTPTYIQKADAAVAKLDADIALLQKKKPPNFQSLIDQANDAKDLIARNIAKPFDDFIKSQRESLAVSTLLAGGHVDEANALKEVFVLQKAMGPLTDTQKQSVLDTVVALRQEQEAQEKLTASRQQDLAALDSVKSTIEGALSGTTKLKDVPKQILASFKTLAGQQLFDKLFGDAFAKLKDQVNGTDTVGKASDRMAAAITTTLDPLKDLATAASDAASAVAGSPSLTAGLTASQVSPLLGDAKAFVGDSANAGLFSSDEQSSANEIVVTAAKKIDSASSNFLSATDLFNRTGKSLGSDIDKLVDPHGSFFATLGSQLGTVLRGSAVGSSIASALGIKSSVGTSLGSVAGSALGSEAASSLTKSGISDILGPTLQKALGSALPVVGSVVGSLVGDLVGGLFTKVKKGNASLVTDTIEGTSVTGTAGNSSALITQSVAEAGSIGAALQSIASQLGGGVQGGLNLGTVGQKGKKFYFDTPDAKDPTGDKDTRQTFDSEAEAQAAALQYAITSGAVTGLDSAVQKALGSSSDVDAAVAEALKVQNVENLIGGIGKTLENTFKTFDASAAENVAIAQKYGLDVLAVEKANAQARSDLVASTLKEQLGSLTDTLASLQYGDLSEGSASDKRAAIQSQIAAAQADAEAGKAGAADTLASLYQQLVQNSKDAYGTAGSEYTSDRTEALTGIQKVIDMQTAAVNEAAGLNADGSTATAAQQTALDTANSLADEGNTLTAQLVTAVQGLPVSIANALASSGRLTVDTSATARAA
jgi:hypothetical protein